MRELSMTQAGFALTGTISGTSSFAQRTNGLWFPMALRGTKNTSQPSRVEVTSAVSRPAMRCGARAVKRRLALLTTCRRAFDLERCAL